MRRSIDLTSASTDKTLTFWWDVDSEDAYDYGKFYDNATQVYYTSGTGNTFTMKTHTLTKGAVHALKWCFEKDDLTSSGTDDLAVDSITIADGNEVAGTTKPSAPATLTLSTTVFSQIDLSWTNGGGDTYQYMVVRGPAGFAPTFTPVDGTTYDTGTEGSDAIIYIGSNTSLADTGLTNATTYYYNVYAYDTMRHYSAAASGSETPFGASAGEHRYWRFRITSLYGNGNQTLLYEFQFKIEGSYQTNAMTSNSTGSIAGRAGASTSASSSYSSSYYPFHAFNGFTATNMWNTSESVFFTSAPYDGNQWISADLVTPTAVEGYRYYVYTSAAHCPDQGFMEYSDNNSTWTKAAGSDVNATCTDAGGWLNGPDF
jgi:hypothetical protein